MPDLSFNSQINEIPDFSGNFAKYLEELQIHNSAEIASGSSDSSDDIKQFNDKLGKDEVIKDKPIEDSTIGFPLSLEYEIVIEHEVPDFVPEISPDIMVPDLDSEEILPELSDLQPVEAKNLNSVSDDVYKLAVNNDAERHTLASNAGIHSNGEYSTAENVSGENFQEINAADLVPESELKNLDSLNSNETLSNKLKADQNPIVMETISAKEIENSFAREMNRLVNEGERNANHSDEAQNLKNRPNIEIRDYRTGSQDGKNSGSFDFSNNFSSAEVSETELSPETASPNSLNNSADGSANSSAVSSAKSDSMSSRSVFLEDALAREIRNNLSGDIVRNASIIVRDGGEGTIRLSLKPAVLGDVKIRLEMVENKIRGLILLESTEALRAFERELPVLEKAFRDSGFSEASLTLTLDNEGWNFNGYREAEEDALSPVIAASRYEAEREEVYITSELDLSNSGNSAYAGTGRTPINLLV